MGEITHVGVAGGGSHTGNFPGGHLAVLSDPAIALDLHLSAARP